MRECPICSARVHIIHEGDGIAAGGGGDLVAYYGEHDPCPGSYEPVTPPVVLKPPEGFAEPLSPPKPPRMPSSERSRLIVEHVTSHYPCSVLDVAKALDVSDRIAGALMLALLRSEALVRGGIRGRYRWGPPCPVSGEVAREVWQALFDGPVEPFSAADELRRTPHGVRAVLGRMRGTGLVVQDSGRYVLVGVV